MTSPREQLAAAIKADLAVAAIKADVYDWGHQPEELTRPAVVVFRTDLDKLPGSLEHSFTVQLMAPQQHATRETEAFLEDLLDEVLVSLQRLAVVAWSKASRKVFLDLFHGWEIEVKWASVDVYQQAI